MSKKDQSGQRRRQGGAAVTLLGALSGSGARTDSSNYLQIGDDGDGDGAAAGDANRSAGMGARDGMESDANRSAGMRARDGMESEDYLAEWIRLNVEPCATEQDVLMFGGVMSTRGNTLVHQRSTDRVELECDSSTC